MKRTAYRLALIAFTTFVGCTSPDVLTPTSNSPVVMQLNNTLDTAPLMFHARNAFQDQSEGLIFQSQAGSHRHFTEEAIRNTRQYFLSYKAVEDGKLQSVPVLQDGLAIIAHPQTPVNSLSTDELRRIYQGFVETWPNTLPITAYSQNQGSDTRAAFEQLVMGRRALSSDIQVVPGGIMAIEAITRTPGAIAYVPTALIDENTAVKVLAIDETHPTPENIQNNLYPLRMTIYVIGQDTDHEAITALIRLLQQPHLFLPDTLTYRALIE